MEKRDVDKLVESFNKVSFSADFQIMSKMNAGALYLYLNDSSTALSLYAEAVKLNAEHRDDYFDYYINTNLCVYYMTENPSLAREYFKKSSKVPALFKPYDAQYIRFRNRLITEMFENTKAGETMSIEQIRDNFKKKFTAQFTTNNTDFFSVPYLLSDAQFWTNN